MANVTAALAPTAHAKQYVFVDEYNRHKRLKVRRLPLCAVEHLQHVLIDAP